VPADLPGDIPSTIEAARITAQATVQAAQIAADAARTNTFISTGGTFVALIGTVVAAYVAYRIARMPIVQAHVDKETEKAVFLAQLQASVRYTIHYVDHTLVTYRGNFSEPVEVRVLPVPEILESRDAKEFAPLGPAINEAIVLVRLRRNDYVRAKAPIQDRIRQAGDDKPVKLEERPADFDPVLATAEEYGTTLNRLECLVSNALGNFEQPRIPSMEPPRRRLFHRLFMKLTYAPRKPLKDNERFPVA
jgi:hypothetical protein